MVVHRNYARYAEDSYFYSSIDEFEHASVPNGGVSIRYGSSFLDLLVQDRGHETTIVLFHAAIDPSKTTLPVFVGQQLVADVEANVIFVSEPSLDKKVAIGWYSGSAGLDLQEDLVRVLRHTEDAMKRSRHLVFFGASAGGFAALYYSHNFPKSIAIVANPQTNIKNYLPEAVSRYEDFCWDGLSLEETGITFDLTTLYGESFPNYVVYLQNRQDEDHYAHHFLPWARQTNSNSSRWRAVIDDWGKGHSPVPPVILMGALGYATQVRGDWEALLNDEFFTESAEMP